MKIRTLHIYNMASIEDELIDFSASPLAESDVFLITGKTGSGKTTILDAICLALYRTTPRLSQCTGVKVENNSDNLALDDPRQLMRRNTGEAFVNLTFQGIDGHLYEAEWHVQRGKKKKPNVSLDPATWSLKDHTSGKTYTGRGEKVNEVREAIQQAVGLEFSQFCRTTMLAQGEFTKFLKSNEKEKVEILEKMTHFTAYTAMGKRLYELTQEKKKALDEAQKKAQDTGLNNEELATLHEEIQQFKTKIKQQEEEQKRLTRMLRWLQDDAELKKEQLVISNAVQKAEAEIQTEEFRNKEQRVQQWHETTDARSAIKEKLEAEAAAGHYEQERKGLASTYQELVGGILCFENLYKEKTHEFEAVKLFLAQHASQMELYEKADRIALQLNQVASDRIKVDTENKKIADNRERLSHRLIPQYQAAEKALADANESLIQCENEGKQRQDELEAIGMNNLYKKQQELSALLNRIQYAKTLLQTLANIKSVYKERGAQLNNALNELEAKTREAESLEPTLAIAKAKLEVADELLKKHNNTVEQWAVNMRHSLHTGDICPVCQQPITASIPEEHIIQALYQQAKAQYDAAKQVHEELIRKMDKLKAEIQAEGTAYARNKQAYDNDHSVAEAEHTTLQACSQCGITRLNEDLPQQLESLSVATLQQIENLKLRIEQGEAKEKEIKRLRDAHQAKKQQIVTLLQPAFERCKVEKEQCEKAIESSQLLIQSTEEALAENTQAINTYIPQDTWSNHPKEYAFTLQVAAKNYHDKQEERHILEKGLEQLHTLLDHAHDTQRNILSALPSWQEVQSVNIKRNNDLNNALNTLGHHVTTNIALSRQATERIDKAQQQITAFLHTHPAMSLSTLQELSAIPASQIEATTTACQQMHSAVHQQHALLANVNSRIQAHQADETSQLITEADSLETLNAAIQQLDQQSNSLNQTLGVKEKILADDKAKKAGAEQLREAAEQARKEYDRWQRVNNYLGDATGTKFQKIAQSYILGSLLHSANHYLQRLAPRYTLRAVPGTLYISLEDAYQGFASRGTDSLSGGESFLVSLALALALADIGETLSVDTLFIDEGFGTLSGQSLTNAIHTLRTLHSQSGRHVGVISHVEEVKANIPVQIQLIQEGHNSSSRIRIS